MARLRVTPLAREMLAVYDGEILVGFIWEADDEWSWGLNQKDLPGGSASGRRDALAKLRARYRRDP